MNWIYSTWNNYRAIPEPVKPKTKRIHINNTLKSLIWTDTYGETYNVKCCICELNTIKTNLDKVKTDLEEIENNMYKFFNTIYSYKNNTQFDTFQQKYNDMMCILLEKFDELSKVKDFNKINSPTKDELEQIKSYGKG